MLFRSRGEQPPLALIAGHQRHGRGQQGRPWCSPLGGVWLSAALPWAQPEGGLPPASPALAVAVGLALELEAMGLQPRIKWPNDLMIDNRKLAGILVETFSHGSTHAAVLGVGINVALQPEQLPESEPALRQRIVSLAMLGSRVDRLRVLACVLTEQIGRAHV